MKTETFLVHSFEVALCLAVNSSEAKKIRVWSVLYPIIQVVAAKDQVSSEDEGGLTPQTNLCLRSTAKEFYHENCSSS
jgi:hypothetical protein